MTTMNKKENHSLVHTRSAAGCISKGWLMAADHIWDIIRGGAPVLLLAALLGIGLGLNYGLILPPVVTYIIYGADVVLSVLWIIQVAGLVQKYHRLGYFPAVRPLLKSQRKDDRPSAIAFWRNDWKAAGRSTLGLLGLIVQQVRHWGSLLGILIVGGLALLCLSFIALLPLMVLYTSQIAGAMAAQLGDSTDYPALLPAYAAICGLVAETASFIFSLLLLLPLAYFGGSLKKEQAEKAEAKKLAETAHD